jgi:hypothetical protein
MVGVPHSEGGADTDELDIGSSGLGVWVNLEVRTMLHWQGL